VKVLITGGTGFIGGHLRLALAAGSHDLVMLSRDPVRARERLPSGISVFKWNPVESPPPTEAFEGVEAVVNLVGESVVGIWTGSKRKRMYESRVYATRNLVRGLEDSGARPRSFVSASAVGYYGDRGDEVLTEDVSPSSDFLSRLCVDWENEALRAESLGIRAVCIRIGLVLGHDGGMIPALLPAAKLGMFGRLGSGKQWWPWVHVDDVAGIARFSIENDISGPVNATAPNPVRQGDFANTLGHVLGRRQFLNVPAALLRLGGDFSAEMLSSKKAVPRRAQEAGYVFGHPDLEPALGDVLSNRLERGAPVGL